MSESEHVQTVDVVANRESPTRTTVETRSFELVVDEPEAQGGTNAGPNPLEYLLAAQAGCLNVTGHQVADDMGLDISSLEIEIAGTFNPATFEGRDADQRAGLQDMEVRLRADADAEEETIATWGERVEERCPVSDNIKNETSVALTVTAD